MKKEEGCRLKSDADSASVVQSPSPFVSSGGELHLSNLGQLSLLRAVMERGVPLRTVVRGFSMTPFIRDQDLLTIAPMESREPLLGDVIAFTQPDTGSLAIHRVIAREGAGWLVRGDNCPEIDGVVSHEHILGRVVAVERNGRKVRLGLGVERAWIAALNRGNGLIRLKWLWHLPLRIAGFTLHQAQALPLYRSLGRCLASRIEIVAASEVDAKMVHRRFNPYEPFRRQPPNPNTTSWVAKRGAKVVGFVQLVYHPEAPFPWVGHWLFYLEVWRPYRGLGIGQALTRRVIEEARAQGAKDLLLAVYEDNDPAISLYRKLGFEPMTLPTLEPEFETEKQQSGRRRIVMCKGLTMNQ